MEQSSFKEGLRYAHPAPGTLAGRYGYREGNMSRLVQLSWWTLLVRGTLAILFGIIVLLWSQITQFTLLNLFGAYTLVDGVSDSIGAVTSRSRQRYWLLLLLHGLPSILVAVAAFRSSELLIPYLLYLIAGRAIFHGFLETIVAVQLWSERKRAWLYALSGLGSLAFGITAAAWPGATTLSLPLLVGIYKVFMGVFILLFALQVYRWLSPPKVRR